MGGGYCSIKGRLLTLTAEVDSLDKRVSDLQGDVGVTGGGDALLETSSSDLFADYAKLLRTKSSAENLSATTTELENRVHGIQSKVADLENEVFHKSPYPPALLATDAQKAEPNALGASL